jgi:hypothetical protein
MVVAGYSIHSQKALLWIRIRNLVSSIPDPYDFFNGSGSSEPNFDKQIRILPISKRLLLRTIFLNITLLIRSYHKGK